MSNSEKKNLELERLIFFSDAIVAIAITLLVFGLKINVPETHHITFRDLIVPWRTYLAFILSFINIAGFWQAHHTIFNYIKKADRRMLFLNLCWLFFIIVLPFTTSILSAHIADTPAVFLYCINVLLLSLFQKFIWDYSDDILPDNLNEETIQRIDVMFTLDLFNGIVAVIVSFFSPVIAFILLFFKIPLFVAASFYIAVQRRKEIKERK